MSNEEFIPAQDENQVQSVSAPIKTKKKRLILLICAGCGALLILCVCLILFRDPKEQAVISFCKALKSGNYQSAYDNYLSESLQNDISYDEFKTSFSGFTFFNDMNNRKTTHDAEFTKIIIEGKANGELQRTLIAVNNFSTNNRFDRIIIIEVADAVYAEKIDELYNTSGPYIMRVVFLANVFTTDFSEVYIERNGVKVTDAGVLSRDMTDNSKTRMFAYFGVSEDVVESDLDFVYLGQIISLKDMIKEINQQ